ncbi:MAG: M6 family metalloprotease domain-containing protein [Prevotella sp.]|jgi:M6 family metalloprotease-like protein
MKKPLIILVALAFMVNAAYALPAWRKTKTIVQPDGSRIELSLRGDEALHYYALKTGEPVVRDAQGYYCYAQVKNGRLQSSNLRVGVTNKQTLRRVAQLNNGREALASLRVDRNALRVANRKVYTGARRGLVILASYSDLAFTYSKQTMDSIMNFVGYQKDYFQGSVHDYFLEASNGKFDLSFDVVGPVVVSKEMSYYGSNNLMGDLHAGELVAEACQLAADSVNFADYDWDGDGEVDQVVVIYAGWGEAMGAPEETIWPQEYTLSQSDYGRRLELDGVKVDKFALTCELYGNEEAFQGERWVTGVGPMCHEFSHCLGLPDFYDTLDPDHFTMEDWDLMDAGCYNLGTYCPSGFTGYEKWYCGWQEPIELTSPITISGMKGLSDGGDFYVVYNDQYSGKRNEYYILENRQWKGFDSWLYGKGLLITHVNYRESDWNNNTVNNEVGKEGMAIIPANNLYTYKDSAEIGNPYPYMDNDSLTNTSTPAATVYNVNKKFRNFMDKPITHITMSKEGLVGFDFMGGGTADAIRVETTEIEPKQLFDLAGRKVETARGVVIVRQGKNIRKEMRK